MAYELLDHFFRRVHTADEIGFCQIKIPLVVDGIQVAERQGGFFHVGKNRSVARLVPERPKADAGMASVPHDHSLHTVNCGARPHRSVARHVLAAHAVALKIALVHDVKAVFVAQLIEERVVGIVARSDRIYIRLLHQTQVAVICLARDCPAVIRVKIVAVHAFDFHLFPVYIQDAAPDLNLFEAYAYLLFNGALTVFIEISCQGVELRILGGPFANVFDRVVDIEDR